jgi:hypothetical protein
MCSIQWLVMESAVTQLDEAISGLAAVDVDTLADDELDADLVALMRVRHRLDAQIARRATRWDTRGVWCSDGSRAPWARLSRTAGSPVAAPRRSCVAGRRCRGCR